MKRGWHAHTDVEVERRGCVQHGVEAWGLDDLVKGALLSDIGHDGCLQLVFAQFGVSIVNLLRLFFRPNGGHDRKTTCE